MPIVKSVAAIQRRALKWKRQGQPVALVPTMGSLHDGHLSLVHGARKQVGARGVVVVSIYVNPIQFGPREDWQSYPRDLKRDRKLCREAGVDLILAPDDRQMYGAATDGAKGYSTYVIEETLSQVMEGDRRPTHFRGVTTVVAKLFHLVLPDFAVFGAKDYQQAAIIQRMIRDLNFPVKMVLAPTIREPDGLALSSRNQYLTAEERRQATVLWETIQTARKRVRDASTPLSAYALKKKLIRLIQRAPSARLDYLEFFDPETLQPVARVKPGMHLALAVHLGKARLIDNGRL